MCDKYYTHSKGDAHENICGRCEKEFTDVKTSLAENTLKKLKEQFKS
jgi:hypothetical protein